MVEDDLMNEFDYEDDAIDYDDDYDEDSDDYDYSRYDD